MDRNNEFDLCQKILQHSDDGNDLSPKHLYLVELGVNGELSPRGQVVLYQLAYKVENGLYEAEPDWFCEIENLTRGKGEDRSVFWKGIRVEHFDHDFWCEGDWKKSMKEDAICVAKTCQFLEENQIDVNMENYMKYCGRFRPIKVVC